MMSNEKLQLKQLEKYFSKERSFGHKEDAKKAVDRNFEHFLPFHIYIKKFLNIKNINLNIFYSIKENFYFL